MNRVQLSIGEIAKLKITFNIIINDENDNKSGSREFSTINRFKYGGNLYTNIMLSPFISLDISKLKDRMDGYNSSLRINFGRFQFPILLKTLSDILDGFKIPNLYYTANGMLYLDEKNIPKYNHVIKGSNNKSILANYSVVIGEHNEQYEGVVLCFNSVDNFCTLSYSELIALVEVLRGINMEALSLSLLQTSLLIKDDNVESLEKVKMEEKSVEMVAGPPKYNIQNTIPNI